MLKSVCKLCSSKFVRPVFNRHQILNTNNAKHLIYQRSTIPEQEVPLVTCKSDRYNSLIVDLNEVPAEISPQDFEQMLKAHLLECQDADRPAMWLNIPAHQSHLVPTAAKLGFVYHHAEGLSASMCQWLRKSSPNKLPVFGTHQIGAAGVVIREDTNQILVVQDANKRFNMWKFPGGLSELGEDISETAAREVYEETGVTTEFIGMLAFRQQHNHPGAFGRSDIFFVCHLKPTSYELHPDAYEIGKCQWMAIEELKGNMTTSPFTQRILQLLDIGVTRGFSKVHLVNEEFQSIYKGLHYKIYHRDISSSTAKH